MDFGTNIVGVSNYKSLLQFIEVVGLLDGVPISLNNEEASTREKRLTRSDSLDRASKLLFTEMHRAYVYVHVTDSN